MSVGNFLSWILIALGIMLGFLLGGCGIGREKGLNVMAFIVAGIPILIGSLLMDDD